MIHSPHRRASRHEPHVPQFGAVAQLIRSLCRRLWVRSRWSRRRSRTSDRADRRRSAPTSGRRSLTSTAIGHMHDVNGGHGLIGDRDQHTHRVDGGVQRDHLDRGNQRSQQVGARLERGMVQHIAQQAKHDTGLKAGLSDRPGASSAVDDTRSDMPSMACSSKASTGALQCCGIRLSRQRQHFAHQHAQIGYSSLIGWCGRPSRRRRCSRLAR